MTVEETKVEEETQVVEESAAELTAADEPKKVVNVEEVLNQDSELSAGDSPKTVEKTSSFKEESNFPSDLKEYERKALVELKAKLEDAISGDGEEEDASISLWGVPLLPSTVSGGADVILLKFLRARDFKVPDALEMLKKTLKWRKDSKIDGVTDEDLASDAAAAAYMSGVDREGHPVCYNVYGVFADSEVYQKTFGTEEKRERFLRWRVQLMEKGIKELDLTPGGVSSLLQINDLRNVPGIGPSKKELRAAMKEAVNLLQDNYPEFVARNIFINVPFWYYAINALLSPFLTQRTKSKFVFARPSKVTETLLKYISAEEIPVTYGGFKRENDYEFSGEDSAVSEITIKPGSTETIEIPIEEVETTALWDLTVLGWEVNYKEEFVPTDQGSYTIIVQKGKKINAAEGPIRNTYRNSEPGKIVLTVENLSSKKKKVLYRHKTKKSTF